MAKAESALAAQASPPMVIGRDRLDRTFVSIMALALFVRLLAIFLFPSLHHPDENYQTLEQAHRLAFGYGVETWDFEDGIRSLVIPYLLAGVFSLTAPILGGPQAYIHAAQILLAAVSLLPVAASYRMGLGTSRSHALIVGVVAATWFELVYFAFRPLTEALSADFLIVALSLASVSRDKLTAKRLALIGLCLGLCLLLRIHLSLGVLFSAIWIAGTQFRTRWLPLAVGALPAFLLFGAADWIAWGRPFESYFRAVWINLIEGQASSFGEQPAFWYVQRTYLVWAGALPLIAFLIGVRLRSSMLWIGTALLIIASHSLISHKEYRFLFPALGCLILVAAMGSADLVERARRHLSAARQRYLIAGSLVLWIATSASLAFAPGFSANWFGSRALIESSFWLAAEPDLCGLLIYDESWVKTGGYAYLHKNIPIYDLPKDHEIAKSSTEAFNFVMLNRSSIPDFEPEFRVARCSGTGDPSDVCVVQRTGSCARLPALDPLLAHSRLGEAQGY